MLNMEPETISTLAEMTYPYGDRVLTGKTLEISLWQIDRSTFASPRQVVVVQTWMLDLWSGFYRCETSDGQRIDSTDLMDHEPTLTADEAGARYWM